MSLDILTQGRYLEQTQAGVPWASELKTGSCYSMNTKESYRGCTAKEKKGLQEKHTQSRLLPAGRETALNEEN